MNFTEGLKQMKSYGGLRLMKEYCRLGLGWNIFKRVCWCVLHGKPIKTVYYDANRMVAPVLLDKYDSLIRICVRKYSEIDSTHDRTKNVWFCWMQGGRQDAGYC